MRSICLVLLREATIWIDADTRLSIDCIRLDQESQNSTLRLQIEQDKNGYMNVELNVNALGKALQRLDESFKR